MKILLAGGTGFIGVALRQKLLSGGHEVSVLTRRAGSDTAEPEKSIQWDGKNPGDWVHYLDGADAVINLAGENIAAKRWTPRRKQEIVSSRLDATRAIVRELLRCGIPRRF